MSSRSGLSRRWQQVRRLPGRTPLRIKLITAVLALVAIALAAISIAGQIKAWKRVMSFPIRCRSAGHNFSKSGFGNPVAVR